MEVLSSRILYHTDDFASLRAFYEDVIGLQVYREYGDGTVTGVVFFLGGGFLEISHDDDRSPPVSLWLQVADVRAEEARLRAAGVTVSRGAERMPWGLVECWAHDPEGNELRLVEVPADHPLRRRV
ncbi:MAG TPA: VOC family protein [Acidimicrobiales bacterium]|nr:VOC family protein [Acidimicrobiales bacterium]